MGASARLSLSLLSHSLSPLSHSLARSLALALFRALSGASLFSLEGKERGSHYIHLSLKVSD
jgi:hypothetical protein